MDNLLTCSIFDFYRSAEEKQNLGQSNKLKRKNRFGERGIQERNMPLRFV